MLGMKGKVKRFLSLSMILAMLLMSVPSMAATSGEFEGTFDITAGQNTIIGEATVTIEDNMLTIDVDLDEGQEAKEYHLYILDQLPTERLTPGQAPIKDTLNPEQEDFQVGPVQIDLDDLEPGQCQDLYLMLHLAVGGETAYGGKIVDSSESESAWFGYIHIQLCEPEDPDPEVGSLTIFKFHDMNENGEFDEDDETALSGIEFEIYNEDDEEIEGSPFTTDEDGLIELTGLPIGEYFIKELSDYQITGQVIVDGLISTYVASNDITDVYIGNYFEEDEEETGSVTVWKFEDEDRDGEWDENEPALEDIEFKLFKVHYPESEVEKGEEELVTIGSGFTDENGKLVFDNLMFGDYALEEHSSYEITTPNALKNGLLEIEVHEEDGEQVIYVGNFIPDEPEEPEEPATIILYKFEDTDKDGNWDENETTLSGIGFELYGSMNDDEPVATGTTDSNGMIIFSGLEPGDYFLDELGDRTITTPVNSQGFTVILDLEADEERDIAVGNFRETTPPPPPEPPEPPRPRPRVTSNDDDDDPVEYGMLRIQKFLDSDEDGIFDDDEFEMVGITFELYDADQETLISTKVTDSDGVITFPNLEFGDYYLREVSDHKITTEGFNADGFSSSPIEIDSEDVLTITVGNVRNVVSAVVTVELPAEVEVIEDPVPLALPAELPQTGEAGVQSYYILGGLMMLAGMSLKRLR
ncbi:SpaA isopeptide-forming pilin-related protein [Acidaminobacter hydrogenoformans]|uniref:LPXTG-motif cell wall anchor domain-containing protein n=1 Tax=Acidaminobacter hydrogenoformans DSM 2784 TaxID=1120920 RepID=A0A1G5RRA0_9FIRM|nr:SpaA isopeptide-forming pilin-related protein [Acidaminobacter hydrogenoformans]SCZ76388.1 LPXTG-motif cell wall anchor domain-containing protein [Acidaminobacter hydrogenoformans DSM 2784]